MGIMSSLTRFTGWGVSEKKSIRLTDPEAFPLFGIAPSASGVTVTAASAMRVPSVRRAVSLIAESVATLPFKTYAENKEAAKDHPSYALVHDWANDWTSAEELRELLTADALLTGQGFAQVVRVEGRPVELHRMDPGAVSIEYDDFGEPSYRVQLQTGGNAILAHHDVLHIQGLRGVSPVVLAREAIGLCIAAEQHLASFYQKGGRPGVILKHEKFLEETSKRKIIQQWHATHGEKNAGGIGILDENMQLEVVSSSHVDAQFLENRLEQIREIARAFNVPPALLYETSRATWSNFEQSHRDFITNTIRPWLARWQAAYSRALLAPDERGHLSIEAVTNDFESADLASRATIYSQFRASGIRSVNEIRALENLPPIAGGDTYENPFTTTPGAAPAPAAPEESQDE